MKASTLAAVGAVGFAPDLVGATADGATEIDGPVEITEPGEYVLVEDIDAGETVTIRILANDVTLDGAGHRIDGSVQIGEDAGRSSDVTVRNLRCRGIRMISAESIVVENNFADGIGGYQLSSNAIRSNTVEGISLSEAGENRITHNSIVGTRGTDSGGNPGVTLIGDPSMNVISNNVILNHHQAGVSILQSGGGDTRLNDNKVVSNLISGNGGPGVHVQEEPVYTSVVGNTITNNGGDGVRFGPLTGGNRVVRNLVGNNDGNGIVVQQFDDVVESNTVQDNGGNGIEAHSESNYVARNGGHGIVGSGSNNVAWANEKDGIRVTHPGSTSHNTAVENGANGVAVEADGVDARRTLASLNVQSGIRATGAADLHLQRNHTVANEGDGVTLTGVHDGKVKFSTSNLNGGRGVAIEDSENGVVRFVSAHANDGDGVAIVDSADIDLTRNFLCENANELVVRDATDVRRANNYVC